MKMYFKLIGVENAHTITQSSDRGFLLLIQHAVLLGLRADGFMNEMQYQYAEEILLKQYNKNIKVTKSMDNLND